MNDWEDVGLHFVLIEFHLSLFSLFLIIVLYPPPFGTRVLPWHIVSQQHGTHFKFAQRLPAEAASSVKGEFRPGLLSDTGQFNFWGMDME